MRITQWLTAAMLAMLLAACTNASPTPEIEGIPTFDKPIGLLPGHIEGTPAAAPAMKPVAKGSTQVIDTPTIGVRLTIPAEWESKPDGDLIVIVDAEGSPMITVGQAYGITPDTSVMPDDLKRYLFQNGFKQDEVTVKESSINVYSYVIVNGPAVDACEYAYLPVGLSSVVLRFERPLCDADGRLNDTASAILRSVAYTGPLQ